MSDRLQVTAPGPLLAVLLDRLSGWKRNTLKGRLKAGRIEVNGQPVTRHDHALQPGDLVEIHAKDKARSSHRKVPLVMLHSDEHLVAIDKPSGLLSVSTDHEKHRTALAMVRDSLGHRERLWPVNRLDRETSGVLLFARSRQMREAVQAGWAEAIKTYLVIVEGHPDPPAGLIDQPLWQDKALNVQVGRTFESKDARTQYQTQSHHGPLALLEASLLTGRRHQIRAHLAWLGHPVLGDSRYGTAGPRLGLHACRLEVDHPHTHERLVLEAEVPAAFHALLGGAPPDRALA
jgi:23S rRNA pseudouridine1911/1915/1917 synthase